MPVNYSYNFGQATERASVVFGILDPPTFTDLFIGTPQYYPGSLIQVEEVLTIFTDVIAGNVVDTDLTWFQPKQYIGTYQILSGGGQAQHTAGDDGYLVDTIQSIRRYNWYTITANPNTPIADYEAVNLKDCNFILAPRASITIPPNITIETPSGLVNFPGETPIFRGRSSISAAPLANTPFFRQIEGVGLYLHPGVEAVQANYKARIINDIYTAYNPFPVSECNAVEIPCPERYNAFIQTNGFFPDELACRTIHPVGSGNCELYSYPCGDGTFIPYYVGTATSGGQAT
jgi:hypothetical protein